MEFVSIKQKLVKLERKFRLKKSDDPEGVMATLLTARRLVSEGAGLGVYAALDAALTMSAPKDQSHAWWSAHRALNGALPAGSPPITVWAKDAGLADIEALFDTAIRNQGAFNTAAKELR